MISSSSSSSLMNSVKSSSLSSVYSSSCRCSCIVSSTSSSATLSEVRCVPFVQLMHWHPGPQCLPCFLQPHLRVAHPVLHLQPLRTNSSCALVFLMFSGASHTLPVCLLHDSIHTPLKLCIQMWFIILVTNPINYTII